MEKEKLLLLKQYIEKEISLENLKSNLSMNELEILGTINELKTNGDNILVTKKNDGIYIINHGDAGLVDDTKYYIETNNPNEIKLAFISDTRLCSKYEQLSILNDIYKKAYDYGVTDIIHCGDISEGTYNSSNLYYESIFAHDVASQSKYIVEHYPFVEGIKTHFITGEHDQTHIKMEKIDIGKLINNDREDMNYLGRNRKRVVIKNINNERIIDILVLHPNGKIPYTISYKPQQFIAAMRSEDKTNIVLHGHWLQTERLPYRGVEEYSVPSVVATTPEMLDKGAQNTIGAWFVTIKLNKKKKVQNIIPMFLPYYKTVENDYKTAKVLKLGVNNGNK